MSYGGTRGLDLRKQGERRTKSSSPGIADAFKGPFDSIEIGAPGEVRVVGDQMTAVRMHCIDCGLSSIASLCIVATLYTHTDPPAVYNFSEHAGGATSVVRSAALLRYCPAAQR